VWRCAPLFLIAVLAGCGSSAGQAQPSPQSRYAGAEIVKPAAAPPLDLANYDGAAVNLDQFRGKAVLVTFVYTKCPNVCPVIVSNLGTAQARLGSEAAHLQIIAVTTDPTNDTPAAVTAFLSARNMTGRMLYLLGSAPAAKVVWTDWHVEASPDSQDASLINHTAAVFGVSASGELKTVYAANFKPADIVHDVPLLAQE
jgi:protein SCO1/2